MSLAQEGDDGSSAKKAVRIGSGSRGPAPSLSCPAGNLPAVIERPGRRPSSSARPRRLGSGSRSVLSNWWEGRRATSGGSTPCAHTSETGSWWSPCIWAGSAAGVRSCVLSIRTAHHHMSCAGRRMTGRPSSSPDLKPTLNLRTSTRHVGRLLPTDNGVRTRSLLLRVPPSAGREYPTSMCAARSGAPPDQPLPEAEPDALEVSSDPRNRRARWGKGAEERGPLAAWTLGTVTVNALAATFALICAAWTSTGSHAQHSKRSVRRPPRRRTPTARRRSAGASAPGKVRSAPCASRVAEEDWVVASKKGADGSEPSSRTVVTSMRRGPPHDGPSPAALHTREETPRHTACATLHGVSVDGVIHGG